MTNQKRSITFSLRTRMTAVMTVLLLLTLATLQYQNTRAQRQVQTVLDQQKEIVTKTVDEQNQEIMSAANVGLSSLTDRVHLYDNLDDKYRNAFDRELVMHLLVITDDGTVEDATEEALVDRTIQLPPIAVGTEGFVRPFAVKGDPVGESGDPAAAQADTYWFRAETTSGPRWIAVVVSTERVTNAIIASQERLAEVIQRTAAERIQSTLAVFALAVVLMILLVWRFTRPIRKLSYAAERVARGDLNFQTGIRRRDEIGQLSVTFDEMVQQLKAKAELEERLNQTERAAVIGRLTGAIAHEIRNPLNYINLSIDHVREKFAPSEERDRQRFERLLGAIKEEIARLNRLVLDVLNFGRPANLNFREIDLRDVIESVLALVRQQADEHGVRIDTALPATPATIEADAEKLKSCFSNIVINALQAMPGGGALTVEVFAAPGVYRVRIGDTGVGIPEDALDRVFEPYYSTKDTGTGLGLAVTKKLVDEHGGRISVTSAAAAGTTFEVDLPMSRGREADASVVSGGSAEGQFVPAGAGNANADGSE